MLFTFTSCFPSHELNETAIVQAIGVDWSKDGFELTMQIFAPKGSGATTAIDTSNNNANIVSAKGETISEALNNATALQGEYIFTGQNRLLIIGEELAKRGVTDIFSYFDRNHLTRQNIEVLVSIGKAKDIISANIDQGILAAETIEKTVENCQINGFIAKCPYYVFSRNMFLYNGSVVVPVIEKSGGQEQKPKEKGSTSGDPAVSEEIQSVEVIKVEKTAVFTDYKLVDILDKDSSKGIVFLSDEIKKTMILAEDKEGNKGTVNIYHCDTKLVPHFKGDQIIFELKIKAKASIDEVLLPKEDYVAIDEIQEFARSAEDMIAKNCNTAFERAVKRNKSNILYLGDLVHKANPELWKVIQESFPKELDKLNFTTNIKLDITRLSIEANKSKDK